MRDPERLLEKLSTVTSFLETGGHQAEKLEELAGVAARMLNADYCSIMLLTQEGDGEDFQLKLAANFGPMNPNALDASVRKNEGIAGKVWATGTSLLIEDVDQSPYAEAAKRRDDPRKSLIISPISVNGEFIGVINVSGNRHSRAFNADDQNLLDIAALFIGKSIQVMQLQNILDSRFAQIAMARKEAEGRPPVNISAVQHPEQMARILAKSFYRELAGAGFGPSQIITIATEIIEQLNENVAKHKKRLDRV